MQIQYLPFERAMFGLADQPVDTCPILFVHLTSQIQFKLKWYSNIVQYQNFFLPGDWNARLLTTFEGEIRHEKIERK